jgi:hypothetical protein
MSSTDQGPSVLGAYFDEVLAPLTARMRAREEQAFPMGPDPACPSYYIARVRPAMAPEDFTAASCANAADVEERLGAHWRALDRTDLLAHLDRIGSLAQAARDARGPGDGSAELSPDLYVMF